MVHKVLKVIKVFKCVASKYFRHIYANASETREKYFYVNLFSNSYFDHISNTNFKVVFNTKSFSQSKVIEKHKTVE